MESSSLMDRLAAVEEAAGRGPSETEFFQEVLAAAADDPAVDAALVWRRAGNGSCASIAAVGTQSSDADRQQLLVESFELGERRILLNEPAGDTDGHQPPVARTLHWPVGGRLIEIDFVPDPAYEQRQKDWMRYLEAAEPHIAGFLNGEAIAAHVGRPVPDRRESGDRLAYVGPIPENEFSATVHASLNLTQLGYTIAHEGRRFIGCDRVGVLIDDGSGLRAVSISGVERVDRRSTTVKRLEELARTAVLTGAPLIYQEGREYPPQIESLLAEYVEASQVRSAIVRPLIVDDVETCGVLVAEWFEHVDVAQYEPRVATVARHSETAVANALQYAEVAWARTVLPVHWARALWRTGRRRWTVAVAAFLLVATLLLVLVPANLVVRARGELQPAERQHVYAAVDGFVDEVLFDDTKPVRKDDPLLRMSNLQLDIDLDTVRSDIDFWEQKLDSIEVLRLGEREGRGESDPARRAAEEADVRQQLANLRRQEQLLEEKVKLLEVTSPIAGRVITWNAVEQLDYRRYVNRSDRLLTVANVDGAWVLELEVPERDSGHVAEALAESEGALDVSWILASHPESTYRARLTELELGTQWDRQQQTTVGAQAALVDVRPATGRAGTTVSARIHCGRRSLGYVWFHDLYEAVVMQAWY